MAVLGPLAPADKRNKLENDLHGTLVQAVQLSQTLRCQRACWSVRSVGPRQPSPVQSPMFFDESIMEDMDGISDIEDNEGHAPVKIVDIIITPALFKRGNTDGEQFENETCIEKAQVRTQSPLEAGSDSRHQQRGHR